MPFLPFVLIVAYQAVSRSARFVLGWATALFFGQIPGNKGNAMAVISLLSLGWLVVALGGGVPLLIMLAGERLEVIPWGLGLTAWQVAGILAATVLGPPAIAGFVEVSGFEERRSLRRWLRRIPVSYPVVGSLGLAVLQMLLIAPVLTLIRLRRRRMILQVPIVIRETDSASDDVADAISDAMASLGYDAVERRPFVGLLSLPLRTMGFAARRLIGSVVRGDPQRLSADNVEVVVYATNAAIIGPEGEIHRMRAAIHRHLALSVACLTWSEESQQLEIELAELHATFDGDLDHLLARLDDLQERIDRAALTSDEWNILYRTRLQVERSARLACLNQDPAPGEPDEGAASVGSISGQRLVTTR